SAGADAQHGARQRRLGRADHEPAALAGGGASRRQRRRRGRSRRERGRACRDRARHRRSRRRGQSRRAAAHRQGAAGASLARRCAPAPRRRAGPDALERPAHGAARRRGSRRRRAASPGHGALMRALPALIVIALLVAASVYVADRPGSVAVVWQGWRVDTSVSVLVLAVVAIAMAAAALFHVLRKVLGGPRAFMRSRREKRRREGYRALTQGMVAVAAGDAAEAQKFARKADVLLAEPPLTLLLSDQAAHRYFSAMIERKETEFLGLRGLIMQALRSGDEGKALSLIERAKALRPSTPWVLSSLFELQARAGKWHDAEATLVEATKRKALPQAESRHRHAVLLHEKSRAAEAKGETREALEHAAKAHKLDPGFAPVTTRYAQLLRAAGKPRPAAKAIEAGWRAQPHPDLAEAYGALAADEPPMQHLKTVQRLAAHNPDHRESRMALAAAALKARLWGEARRHLEAAGAGTGDGAPTPRICRLMAELEEA